LGFSRLRACVALVGPHETCRRFFVARLCCCSRHNSPANPKVVSKSATEFQLSAAGITATFDPATGLLREVRRGEKIVALKNGPRLAFARPPSAGTPAWLQLVTNDPSTASIYRLATPQFANLLQTDIDGIRAVAYAALKLGLSPAGTTWKTIFDSSRRSGDGGYFEFSPQTVAAIRISDVRNERGAAMAVKTVRGGYAAGRFPAIGAAPAVVSIEDTGISTRAVRPDWTHCIGRCGGMARYSLIMPIRSRANSPITASRSITRSRRLPARDFRHRSLPRE
jgi:hypothetical protein